MNSYIRSSTWKSLVKYGRTVLYVRPLSAVLRELGGISSAKPTKILRICDRRYGAIAIRPSSNDLKEICALWHGQEYSDELYHYLNTLTNPTVLDFGAHIGGFVVSLAIRCPHVKIIAYEPEEQNYALLTNNLLRPDLEKVEMKRLALSNIAGVKRLHLSNHNDGNSLDRNNSGNGISQEVTCITLQDACATVNGHVVVKMDIEGHEYEVMAAMDGNWGRINAVCLEYHLRQQSAQLEFTRVQSYLLKNGFQAAVDNSPKRRTAFYFRE